MKLEHTLTSDKKINSTWLKDLNIRHNAIKLLEENIGKTFSGTNYTNAGKTFSDKNCTNVFLGQPPKAIEIKAKINKWDLIKALIQQRKPQSKKQHMNWEKIFANDATDKSLISKIYKHLIQLNNNDKNQRNK